MRFVNAFGSHKYAGKSVLRYKHGVDILTGNFVWVKGPYPRRHERERVTISRTMPPPKFFPTALELMDTNIDPRGGHLTINKGRRR